MFESCGTERKLNKSIQALCHAICILELFCKYVLRIKII
jgi:hypothetical protein